MATTSPLDGTRAIIPRLVGGGAIEGSIVHVTLEGPVAFRADGDIDWLPLVPTGSVEWFGERPIEVWVPKNRLDEWREMEESVD